MKFIVAGAVFAVAGLVTQFGPLLVIAMAAFAAAPLSRYLHGDIAFLVAPIVTLCAVVVVGVAASVITVPIFSGWSALVMCLTWCVAMAIWWWRNTPDLRTFDVSFRWYPLGFILPAATATYALCAAVHPELALRWTALTTNNLEHARMVQHLREVGYLDVMYHVYPQGLHLWFAAASQGVRAGSTVTDLVAEVGAMTLVSFAYAMASMVVLAIRCAATIGVRLGWTLVTAIGVSAWLLGSGSVFTQFIALGAGPTTLAFGMLATGFVVLIGMKDSPLPVYALMTPLQAVAVGYLWTAALVWVAVTVLVILAALMMRPKRSNRVIAIVLAGHVVGLMINLPILRALFSSENLAGTPGPTATPPLLGYVLAIAGIALAGFWAHKYRSQTDVVIALMTILPSTIVYFTMLWATGNPTKVLQWHPIRALWFGLWPIFGFGLAGIVWFIDTTWGTKYRNLEIRRSKFLVRSLTGAVILAVFAAFVLPRVVVYQRVTQLWSTSEPLDAALTNGNVQNGLTSEQLFELANRFDAQYSPKKVLPVELGPDIVLNRVVTRVLTQIVVLHTKQPMTTGSVYRLCQEVDALGGSDDVVVVTTLDVDFLHARASEQGCSPLNIQSSGIDTQFTLLGYD